MTLPDERYRAVLALGTAALSLCKYASRKSDAPRVPRGLLVALRDAMRHYPTRYDLDQVARVAPHVFSVDSLPVVATESEPRKELR